MKAVFAALLLTSQAARFKRASTTTRTISGVKVENYREGANEWMVMFKEGTSEDTIKRVCNGRCALTGHDVPFASVHGSEDTLAELLNGNSDVAEMVEVDAIDYAIPEISAHSTRAAASWGLDSIGASGRPNTGRGVNIYVQDTGIRVSHTDFGGRASQAYDLTMEDKGVNCNTYGGSCGGDVQGHGTHCAGTAGGTKYGVAPSARIYAVKTLSDQGSGARAWQVGGIDWVSSQGDKPAVLSMSLGGTGKDTIYVRAVNAAVSKGVVVVVAAGNSNGNTCYFSPAFVPSAITVGATDKNNARASYSNYGKCNDIMAPGSAIVSASLDSSDRGKVALSGTSMACPHVSGAAALLLSANPSLTPAQVLSSMQETAVKNMITGIQYQDPNTHLWVSSAPAPVYAPTDAPTAAPTQKCPRHARFSEPDEHGDCHCRGNYYCSINVPSRDCPTSTGPGGWGGYYFSPTCKECRCYLEAY